MKTQNKKINSKGQIGETLTWIVATLIIIVILVFFILGSSLLSGTKKVGDTFRESLTSSQVFEGTDLFLKKSLFTYVSLKSSSDQLVLDKKLSKMSEAGDFSLDYNSTKKEISVDYSLR